MNQVKISVNPGQHQRAIQIADKSPEKAFKNSWQEVIRLAVHYGLKRIEHTMQYNKDADRAAEVRRYINKTRLQSNE